jgi:GT2 family glycosyltransferase
LAKEPGSAPAGSTAPANGNAGGTSPMVSDLLAKLDQLSFVTNGTEQATPAAGATQPATPATHPLLQELRAEFQAILAGQREEFRAALAGLEERLAREDCRLLTALIEKRMDFQARLASLEESHAKALSDQEVRFVKALAQRDAELQTKLAVQEERHAKALAETRAAFETKVAAQEEQLVRTQRELAEKLRAELAQAFTESRAFVQAQLRDQDSRATGAQVRLVDKLADAIRPLAEMQQTLGDLRRGLQDKGTRDEGRGTGDEPSSLAPGSSPLALPAPEAPKPALRPIVAFCDRPNPSKPPLVRERLHVKGWALATTGVRIVELFIDGKLRGQILHGSLRPDVAASHPQYPDSEHSGISGVVPIGDLADGEHAAVLRITANDGAQLELPSRFSVAPVSSGQGEVPDINAEYPDWLRQRSPSPADLDWLRAEAEKFAYRPTISLAVPVYNTAEDLLTAMVESVVAQTYSKWELCLANDASTAPHVRPFLERWAARDRRIKITTLAKNQGIAGATNAALTLAKGEFVGLLDSDDVLMPYALHETVRVLNEAPGTDLVYSDEDKMDEKGQLRWDPFFKPDWSPDLLLSMNYICHFGVYRRSIIEELGGFRAAFNGSQDYDLVLRFTERTNKIVHVPSILYCWRAIQGSGATDSMAKPYAVETAGRAVADALKRRGVAGRVERGFATGRWRVRYEIKGQPGVTIVLATGGKMQFLEPCLKDLLTRTSYANLQILVVDNSEGSTVAALCQQLGARHKNLQYREFRLKPFNYPAINNFAVRSVETPYIVLMNDDMTVITPDWVEAMLEHAQRPEVGIVGPKLLYPDEAIQHAGVILGPYQNSGHAFKHFPANDPGYFDLAQVIRNCSAITFACAMMRRALYDEVGGLDEKNLRVAFNDVDMCLRVRERGYWNVYTPHAVLYHLESVTKKVTVEPGELEFMQRRWAHVIQHDPFYNPNLTRKGEDYTLNLEEDAGPLVGGLARLPTRRSKSAGARGTAAVAT